MNKPTPEHYMYLIIKFYYKLNNIPYYVDIHSDTNQVFTFFTDRYITKYQQYYKDGKFFREIISKEDNERYK